MARLAHTALRQIIATAATACAALAMLSVVAPSVQADETPESNSLAEFGACLHGEGKGSLILLMDQSGSLRQTDPNFDRTKAGQYLLERFNQFATSANVQLDVKVAGFAANYASYSEWTPINSGLDTVKGAVDKVSQDLKDYDTDYWIALHDAQADLDKHAAETAAGCKAIAWLTDGEYDIDVREDDQAAATFGKEKPYAPGTILDNDAAADKAVEAGKNDICRATGVADQMRTSKINLIAVGLTQNKPNFDFVKRVLSGGGAEATTIDNVPVCGDVPYVNGVFVEANDLDSLYLAFDSISTPGQTTQNREGSICQGQVCNDTPLNFVLDESLSHVQILVTSTKDDLEAHLLPPSGQNPIVFLPGQNGAADAAAPFRWLTKRTLEFTLDSSKMKEWTGEWRLVLVDKSASSTGAKFTANLHLASFVKVDLTPLKDLGIHKGETYDNVKLKAVDSSNGKDIKLSDLKGEVSVKVALVDSAGTEHVLVEGDKTALDKPLTLDTSQFAVGTAQVRSTLNITTASFTQAGTQKVVPGTKLAPTQASQDIAINAPLSFPIINGELNFGTIDGQTEGRAELAVAGEGCLWIEGDTPAIKGAPANIGSVKLTSAANSEDTCLKLSGADTTLPVTLSFDEPDNGALLGDVTVHLISSADPSLSETVTVPFSADVQKPFNTAMAWGSFIIAMILGLGLPIAALYLFKYMGAVIPAGNIGVVVFPFDVPKGDPMMPVSVTVPDKTHLLPVKKGARSLEIGSYRFRVRAGASPVTTGWVELDSAHPSTSGEIPGHKNGKAILPLAMRGKWVAVLEQGLASSHVTLIILTSGQSREDFNTVAAKIAKDLRPRLEELRKALGAVETEAGQGNVPQAPVPPAPPQMPQPPQMPPRGFSQPVPPAPGMPSQPVPPMPGTPMPPAPPQMPGMNPPAFPS